MKAEARAMQQLGIHLDRLVSSPLTRTMQTAEIVAQALDIRVQVEHALAPGCTIAQLSRLLAGYSAAERIMFVGHEPDCSELIAALTGGSQVSMKKGALALVSLPHDDSLDGILIYLLPPKVLRALGA